MSLGCGQIFSVPYCSTSISHLPRYLLSSRLIWLESYFPLGKNQQILYIITNYKCCSFKLCLYIRARSKKYFSDIPRGREIPIFLLSFLDQGVSSCPYWGFLFTYHPLTSSFSLSHTDLQSCCINEVQIRF